MTEPIIVSMLISIHHPILMSLKEKRKLRLSIINHLKHKFNISIIESGELDNIKRTQISLVTLCQDESQIPNIIDKITNSIYLKIDSVKGHVEITTKVI